MRNFGLGKQNLASDQKPKARHLCDMERKIGKTSGLDTLSAIDIFEATAKI